MTIRIPATVYDGLAKWMVQEPWPGYFQEAIHDHLHAYCDAYDLDTFEELAGKIGAHWVTVLKDVAMNDFLTRETRDGNVVDQYLKRRGWNEKAIPKTYLKGIRDSVMSIYEVSDVRPGASFMARDLILGGDPFLVTEHSATRTMLQWEHLAMRIVEVRGHHIIAGGLLPFQPELSAQVIDEVNLCADDAEVEIRERLREQDKHAGQEVIRRLSLAKVLKTSTPLFSEAWLEGTVLDPDNAECPTLLNAEGDEVEFIELHCSFARGTTRKQLRDLLNATPDMEAASSRIWNWVAPAREEAKSRAQRAGSILYKAHLEDGALALGTIELKGEKLQARVNSAVRAKKLQSRLKDILGNLVAEPVMVHQTVEQAMAAHRTNPAPIEQADLPPEVESQIITEFYDRHYRETLDQPIPMLGDTSPRVAAKTPEGKEKVATWLKVLETGEARMRQSRAIEPYDFAWMWQELGVSHLRK